MLDDKLSKKQKHNWQQIYWHGISEVQFMNTSTTIEREDNSYLQINDNKAATLSIHIALDFTKQSVGLMPTSINPQWNTTKNCWMDTIMKQIILPLLLVYTKARKQTQFKFTSWSYKVYPFSQNTKVFTVEVSVCNGWGFEKDNNPNKQIQVLATGGNWSSKKKKKAKKNQQQQKRIKSTVLG